MKRAERNRTYQSREHVKERDAEEKRNRYHSTKTAQQAGPVDMSAKIAALPHVEVDSRLERSGLKIMSLF
jgi:hypothetical protein